MENPPEEVKAEEMLESSPDLKDLTRHREEAVNSETFKSLRERLKENKDVVLDTGYDLRDGLGLVAKLEGKNGGEVLFFEWNNSSDDTHWRDIPSDESREIGVKLAERLRRGDTAKLGPTDDDGLLHTPDPERVLKTFSELGIKPSGDVEPPSEGYKRFTIRF